MPTLHYTSARQYVSLRSLKRRKQLELMKEEINKGGMEAIRDRKITCTEVVFDPWDPPKNIRNYLFSDGLKLQPLKVIWRHIRHRVVYPLFSSIFLKTLPLENRITRSQIGEDALRLYTIYSKEAAQAKITASRSFFSSQVSAKKTAQFKGVKIPSNFSPIWEHRNMKANVPSWIVVRLPEPYKYHIILQATVTFSGEQRYYVKDNSGKIVLGSLEWTPITDNWILEKMLHNPHSAFYVISDSTNPDEIEELYKALQKRGMKMVKKLGVNPEAAGLQPQKGSDSLVSKLRTAFQNLLQSIKSNFN